MCVLITVYNCGTQYSTEPFWKSSLLSSRQSSQLRWCLLEGRWRSRTAAVSEWAITCHRSDWFQFQQFSEPCIFFHSCKPTYSSYIHKPLLCLFLLCILALRSGITECMKEPLTYTVHPVIDSHHIFAHLKTDKDQRLYLSTEAPDVCRWIREPSSDWFSTMKSSSTCWASISYWLRVWHHNNHNIYINRSDSIKQQSMITIQRPQNITN